VVGGLLSRLASIHKARFDRLMRDMDSHIDMLVKRPGMFAGNFGPHQLNHAEMELMLLLGYRYHGSLEIDGWRGRQHVWFRAVMEAWPEGVDKPGALGWMLKHLHRDDENWDGWSEAATKLVANIRARHGKEEE
jgi:hypothetical protein